MSELGVERSIPTLFAKESVENSSEAIGATLTRLMPFTPPTALLLVRGGVGMKDCRWPRRTFLVYEVSISSLGLDVASSSEDLIQAQKEATEISASAIA